MACRIHSSASWHTCTLDELPNQPISRACLLNTQPDSLSSAKSQALSVIEANDMGSRSARVNLLPTPIASQHGISQKSINKPPRYNDPFNISPHLHFNIGALYPFYLRFNISASKRSSSHISLGTRVFGLRASKYCEVLSVEIALSTASACEYRSL